MAVYIQLKINAFFCFYNTKNMINPDQDWDQSNTLTG